MIERRGPRLLLAVLGALLLPFPGPHVDRWLPVGQVLLAEDARSAPAAFFLLAGVLVAVYTGVVYLLLTVVRRLGARTRR